VVHILANYLSKELNTRISVQSVDISWFLDVELLGVVIEDQHKQTILKTSRIRLDIGKIDIQRKYLGIYGISLSDAQVNIVRYASDSLVNYAFLADYFGGTKKNDDTGKVSKPWQIGISGIKLSNSGFSYNNELHEPAETGLDYNHLEITNLNLEIRRLHLGQDSITASIRELSMVEKSGFTLNRLNANCHISSDSIVARQLHLITPGSEINANIKFRHNGYPAYQHFIDSVNMSGDFDRTTLHLSDIGYFAPSLLGMTETVKIHGNVKGTVSSLKARNFRFAYRDNTYFDGNISMDGLPDIYETFIHLKVNDFTTSYSDISSFTLPGNKTLGIPEIVANIGKIRIKGYFTGFINDFVSSATFNTGTGTIVTDISLRTDQQMNVSYSGHLNLINWQLGKSVKAPEYLGLLDFSSDINGGISPGGEISASLGGTVQRIGIMGNEFHDISLNGEFANKEFNGELSLRDELINLDFNGLIDFSEELPRFDFVSVVENAYLNKLNLWERDSSSCLTTTMNLNFSGSNLDNLLGSLSFYNTLYKESGNLYPVHRIELVTKVIQPGLKSLTLSSDLADAEFTGNLVFSDLYASFLNIINAYLPSFQPAPAITRKITTDQHFEYSIEIKDVSYLTTLFLPSLHLSSKTYLFGSFNSATQTMLLNGQADEIIFNGITFNNWYIKGQNVGNSMEVNTGTSSIVFREPTEDNPQRLGIDNFGFIASMRGDSITYNINWKNNETGIRNLGDINGIFTFDPDHRIRSSITNAEFIVNDSLFTTTQNSDVIIDSTSVSIDNLVVKGNVQQLGINGKISENPADVLYLTFRQFDISNADLLINRDGLDFDGILNGNLSLSDLYGTPLIQAAISLNDFAFNGERLGNAKLDTRWDNTRSGLEVDLSVIYQGNVSTHIPVSAKGYIYPEVYEGNNFDLTVNTINYNLATLDPFLKGFASELRGYATGGIKMTGTFDKPAFTGNLELLRTQLKIDYLNVTYSLADKVTIDPRLISATNVMIYDSLGNTGLMNFKLRHNYFRDMFLDIDIQANNLAGLNTTFRDNELFYGSVFATGNIAVSGPFDDLRLSIRARPNEETNIYIPINLNVDASENEYIRFVNSSDSAATPQQFVPSTSGLNLDIMMDVNKDAGIQLFLPDNIGNIKARGSGQLRMGIDTRGDFTMFGEYVIEEGSFLFTLRNILNRVFTIDRGSTISFSGSPYDADLNVQAVYKVRASLKGIPELAAIPEYANRNVPVNCVIHLKNNLYNPDISFSIRLPDAEEELRRAVFAAIDTTNNVAMTQQMVSLLLMKSFSFSGTNNLAGSVGSSSIEMITTQLSSMLSQISDDIDIGVNYRTGDALTSDALELALSTHLFDDRVTIDGNFGLVNSSTAQNTNNLIGDVTVDVKLTRDGKLRVKAYNKSNNPFEISSYNANYKQGVGVYYRYEFDRFSEIFRRNRKKPIEPVF